MLMLILELTNGQVLYYIPSIKCFMKMINKNNIELNIDARTPP